MISSCLRCVHFLRELLEVPTMFCTGHFPDYPEKNGSGCSSAQLLVGFKCDILRRLAQFSFFLVETSHVCCDYRFVTFILSAVGVNLLYGIGVTMIPAGVAACIRWKEPAHMDIYFFQWKNNVDFPFLSPYNQNLPSNFVLLKERHWCYDNNGALSFHTQRRHNTPEAGMHCGLHDWSRYGWFQPCPLTFSFLKYRRLVSWGARLPLPACTCQLFYYFAAFEKGAL